MDSTHSQTPKNSAVRNREAQNKRKRPSTRTTKAQEKKRRRLVNQANDKSEGTHDQILATDVKALRSRLGMMSVDDANDTDTSYNPRTQSVSTMEKFAELDNIVIKELSSTGDGLGVHPDHPSSIFTVPFALPGDVVRAKFVRDDHATGTTTTDFVSVIQPSAERDDSLVKCRYFATCSGCQFQMLPYEHQLKHKRRVVLKAYENFSGLPSSAIPQVGDTIGSPLQYGYRTKLTPHFNGPQGKQKDANGQPSSQAESRPIGYMKKGTRYTMDIEECPIGTPAVQLGLHRERARLAKEISNYRRGATVLLRESTQLVAEKGSSKEQRASPSGGTNGTIEAGDTLDATVYETVGDSRYAKTCISSNTAVTTEYVDDFVFKNSANAFFQNNNSILSRFTDYIRQRILPSQKDGSYAGPAITNLIDAYSGSGLFTVTLSSLFKRSIGIDISKESIGFANQNAVLNGLNLVKSEYVDSDSEDSRSVSSGNTSSGDEVEAETHGKQSTKTDSKPPEAPAQPEQFVSFIAATASKLFRSVSSLDPLATAVVLDPPRKGCDEDFLRQLLDFGPQRIVYVSCNVHTQARDVGWILRGGKQASSMSSGDEALGLYELESLTGFDFFPQTSHVESVAILRRNQQVVS